MSDKKMPPGPRPVDPVFLAQIAATLMGSGGHNVKTAVAKASALINECYNQGPVYVAEEGQ